MKMNLSYVSILLMIFLSFNFSTKYSLIIRADISNDRPIIGILTQESSHLVRRVYRDMYHSYIAASYVKFIEGAGGRVVPIWIGKDTEYYRSILGKINGVLLPGGNTFFNQTGGYAEAGSEIYKIAKKLNKKGDYFPIIGICLGFELLTYVAANNVEHRIRCSSQKQALPLHFEKDYRTSRLFGNAPLDITNILKTENVTINFHHYCITKEALEDVNLDADFRITSYNTDINGVQFVSSLEHNSLPFYGLQFHPEKNLYEWIKKKNIPHTANAVRVGQYFANFVVNEARKSTHRFPNYTEELNSLIYNYPTFYTGIEGSSFQQCYLFRYNRG